MLRRHRQLRKQVHRLLDVGLFAIGLWLAHGLREAVPLDQYFSWVPLLGNWLARKWSDPILPFYEYVWLYAVILPVVPIFLESQGFYQRPLFFSRHQTAWPLLKTSILATLSVILMIFLTNNQANVARSIAILFGAISFGLVYL